MKRLSPKDFAEKQPTTSVEKLLGQVLGDCQDTPPRRPPRPRHCPTLDDSGGSGGTGPIC